MEFQVNQVNYTPTLVLVKGHRQKEDLLLFPYKYHDWTGVVDLSPSFSL